MLTVWRTLARAVRGATPSQYDVAPRPGVSATSYVRALHLGAPYGVNLTGRGNGLAVVIGLIGTLTLLLAIVAGLGVLNTVVLHTRERVHDLSVFKAIG